MSPDSDSPCRQTGALAAFCASAELMIVKPEAVPSAGATAAAMPPCKRCLRFSAKGKILS
jgi:hypothetical protein